MAIAKMKPKRGPGRPTKLEDGINAGVRISAALSAEIDAWAKAAGMSRSDAMRQFLQDGVRRQPRIKGTR
jgi:hypothetical protein